MPADPGCKVDSAITSYGLETADPVYESINEGLLTRWNGTDEREAMGYRSLTEWFNKRLLKQVYDEHGRESLGARLDSDYEALQSDNSLISEEMVESLHADGIDGTQVQQDMVSWGTMRTHLQECLDGEKEPQTARTDWEKESIETAKAITREKTEKALSALATKGEIADADTAEINVQVQISCDSCPTRVPFTVALEQGYVCEQHSRTKLTSN